MNQMFDFGKSWSTTFNRFAWGAIALYIAIYLFGLSNNLRTSLNSAAEFSPRSLIAGLAFVTFSLVVGNIIISIGSFLGGPLVNDKTDTERAVKVSNTKNDLLIQRYLDARLKLETSQGFEGLIAWFLFLIVLKVPLGQIRIAISSAPVTASQIAQSSLYGALFGILGTGLAFGLAKLVDWSAKRSISAIVDVLDKFYPTALVPSENNGKQQQQQPTIPLTDSVSRDQA